MSYNIIFFLFKKKKYKKIAYKAKCQEQNIIITKGYSIQDVCIINNLCIFIYIFLNNKKCPTVIFFLTDILNLLIEDHNIYL